MKKLVNKFYEIAKDVNKKFIDDIETRDCPDVLAGCNGKFYFSKNEREKVESLELSTDMYNDYQTVVIILESPHIEEYSKNNKFCPTPAIGRTGTNLQRHFNQDIIFKHSKTLNKNKNYRVILMNTIQYQCSLGVATKIYRDDIWDRLWKENDIVKNFVNRLKSYNPKVIFNGCTEDSNKARRTSVSQTIRNNFDNIELFEMNHPCYWERRKKEIYENMNIIRV